MRGSPEAHMLAAAAQRRRLLACTIGLWRNETTVAFNCERGLAVKSQASAWISGLVCATLASASSKGSVNACCSTAVTMPKLSSCGNNIRLCESVSTQRRAEPVRYARPHTLLQQLMDVNTSSETYSEVGCYLIWRHRLERSERRKIAACRRDCTTVSASDAW